MGSASFLRKRTRSVDLVKNDGINTTLLESIAGKIRADSGQIRIF